MNGKTVAAIGILMLIVGVLFYFDVRVKETTGAVTSYGLPGDSRGYATVFVLLGFVVMLFAIFLKNPATGEDLEEPEPKTVCPDCGVMADDAVFCPKCGRAMVHYI
ncbi:Uncharacterised protein [Candidatus Norongarragalina meridionalis]|nr:Uncharacterised protein [Candidatus Norongarragalina meridionalis]